MVARISSYEMNARKIFGGEKKLASFLLEMQKSRRAVFVGDSFGFY